MKAQLTKPAITVQPGTLVELQVYQEAFAFIIGHIDEISVLVAMHSNVLLRRADKVELYSLAEATCRAVFSKRTQRGVQLRGLISSKSKAAQVVEFPLAHNDYSRHQDLVTQIRKAVFSFIQSRIGMEEMQEIFLSVVKHSQELRESQLLSILESACTEILADTNDMMRRCDLLGQHVKLLCSRSRAR